ncbi:Uma2 family endonuclease [Kyrpidia spormannii]|uniref:Uma2 family endonuclease n=1 Tax=Kyrpidia spormannii TaxID=2055160 RepID=A0A6F9EI85_9BACL|nr:Uma2 family endonuclease [Kyrpidia spormannii]CAB3396004.1 Uma2 family endonuclease [Kyrpidia spormannii]
MPRPRASGSGRYTYEDYQTWDGGERWELIDGVPYLLSSPSPEHQQILMQLSVEIGGYLRGKACRAFAAPMDLTFSPDSKTKDVVQPDLFVICDPVPPGPRVIGAPVWIVEILSPSTAANDLIRKMNLYQRAGVREYWIVDPMENRIHVYLHDGTVLRWQREYQPGDTLAPSMFSDLVIQVDQVFDRRPLGRA